VGSQVTRGLAPGDSLADDPWNGALPTIWPTVRLGHLAEFITGRTPDKSKAEYWHNGTIPWVSPKDIKSEVVSGSADRVTELAVEEGAARLAPADSVLVVVHGMIDPLPVAIAANEVAISQDIKGLACRPRIRPDFLRTVLVSQPQWLISHGASQTHGMWTLPVRALRRLEIPCPPIEVQDEVMARVRGSTANLDALIRIKETELRLLAERKDAIIASAVTGAPWSTPGKVPAAVPWLTEIPSNWEVRRLGDLGRIVTGATPSRDDDRYWIGGTTPWLTSTVVNEGEVASPREQVTAAALQKYHLPILQPGAVLVAAAGQGRTRGLAAVLSLEAATSQNLVSVQPDPAKLDTWFLRWVLFAAYDFLRGISDDGGGSRGVLTGKQVANLRVPLPPLAEQRSIAEYIARETARIDKISTAAEHTIQYLRERRTTLLASAATGNIDKYGIK
jgi:type I restriction enzyme, S subunit